MVIKLVKFSFVLVCSLSPLIASTPAQRLSEILDLQEEKVKQRYIYRNPMQTLDFFGIEPGMTVVEALPGHGWYSKILIPYLGKDGALVGVDYSLDMYPNLGFITEQQLDEKQTWVKDWTNKMIYWRNKFVKENKLKTGGAAIGATMFGDIPIEFYGHADAVLFIRALHNLVKFEKRGEFLSRALNESYLALKPGGILAVVEAQVDESVSDEDLENMHGYMKKSQIVKLVEEAGFKLVSESDINANPKDKPQLGEATWRLPPMLKTSKDDVALRQKYMEIGETNRMTLKFVKID